MISLLKNSILRRSLLFRTSFFIAKTLDQHIERNKAILASQIISTIKESPINQYRSSKPYPSLRQTILKNIQTYQIDVPHQPQQQRITSAVRYALKEYFTDGVLVPYSMCSQIKYTYTQTIVIQEITESNQQQDETQIDESKTNRLLKLQFCPTYFVTGQVFRYIFEDVQFRYLTGQLGVGKTHSLILYTLLSEIIFKYRHNYCKLSKMSQLSPKINPDIPKAFYWCANMGMSEQTQRQTSLANIIKTRFYEINCIDKIIKEITLSEYSFDTIRSLMENNFGIKTVLLFDQISELTSVLSDDLKLKLKTLQILKEKLTQIQTGKQTKASKKLQQQINDQLQDFYLPEKSDKFSDIIQLNGPKNIMNFNIPLNIQLPRAIQKQMKKIPERYKIYDQYSKLLLAIILRWQFKNFIYLSSTDIEGYFLDQLNLMGFSKQSRIQKHQRKIYYPTRFNGAIPIADTVELIIFNLQKKWKKSGYKTSQKNPSRLLQKIKQLLLIHIRKEQFFSCLPLCIEQVIDQQTSVNLVKIQNSQSKGKLSKIILSLMKKFQQKSEEQIQDKLKMFIDKKMPVKDHQQLKFIWMAQLWSQSYEIMYQDQNDLQTQNEQEKINQIRIEQPVLKIKLIDMDQGDNIFKQMAHAMPKLFGFEYDRLQCFVNPYLLLKIFNKKKKRIYRGLLEAQSNILEHIESDSSLGKFFQNMFVQILQKGNTSMVVTISQKTKEKISLQNILSNVGGFIPIPKTNASQHKNFFFLQSFVTNLNQLMTNSKYSSKGHLCLFLFPLKKIYHKKLKSMLKSSVQKKNQSNSASRLIDFVICNWTTQKLFTTLQVTVFDPILSKNRSKEYKIKKFFMQMHNFKDQYDKIEINGKNTQVTINYIVITTAKLTDFNCKQVIENFIHSFEKDIQLIKNEEDKKNSLILLNEMKKSEIQDDGNSCKIKMRKTYKSGSQVVNTISVISLSEDIELICQNQKKVSIEMALVERYQQDLNDQV